MKIVIATVLQYGLLLVSFNLFSQTNFRTKTSGNWSDVSIWEVETPNGSANWVAASAFPTSASGTINILSTHSITVTANLTIDQATVNSGSTLIVNDGINLTLNHNTTPDLNISSGSTLKLLGESYLSEVSTAARLSIGGDVILGSLDASGALQTGTTGGNIRVTTRTVTSGSRFYYQGTAAQVMGNGNPNITGCDVYINNPNGVSVSNSPVTITIGGSLYLVSGDLNVVTTNFTVKQDLTLTSSNLIFDTSDATLAAKTLTVNGNINLTGGQVNFLSGSANSDNAGLTLAGDITGTQYFTFSGVNCRVAINGSGTLSRNFPINTAVTLESLTVNRVGVTLIIPQDLTLGNSTVSGGLTLTNGDLKMKADLKVTFNTILTNGTLYFDDHTVELQRTITSSGTGLFSANANSTLKITGTSTTTPNYLYFSPTGNTLGTFTLNRSGSGSPNVSLNSTLTIANAFYLSDGVFFNQSGLTMSTGSSLIRTGQATFYSGALGASIAPSGSLYNVVYNNYTNGTDGISTTTTSLSTGVEIQGSVQDLTNNITGTLTNATPVTVPGTMTLNSGVYSNASGLTNFSNGASLVRNGTATFTGSSPAGGSYNVTYNGTTYSNGVELLGSIQHITSSLTGTLTWINPITASGTLTVNSGVVTCGSNAVVIGVLSNSGTFNSPTSTLTLSGDFSNSGTFTHNNATVNFNGISAISGTSATSFYNISVGTGNSLTWSSGTINIAHHLVNDGTIYAHTGTVNFNGVSAISGASVTSFKTIIISGTLNSPSINVAGDFENNGTFTHSGTLTFNGSTTVSGTTTPTAFKNVTLSGTALTFPSTTINISGDLVFTSGSFHHGGGTVVLNGTVNQNLSANGASFNHLTANKLAGTTVTLGSDMSVEGALILTSGNIDFSGETLTLNGTFSGASSDDHYLMASAASTLNIGGTGSFGMLYFSPSANTIGSMEINRLTSGVPVYLGNALHVSSNLKLTKGDFESPGAYLAMGSSSTLTRTPDAAFTSGSSIPAGGPYNLIYDPGTASDLTTGIESKGTINNMSSNLSGTVTQSLNLLISGILSINSGTWTAGANTIAATELSVTGIFNSPSSTLTLTGDLTNNGIFNGNGGTTFFNGSSKILGTTTPDFHSVVINPSKSLTASSGIINEGGDFTNQGTFNHNNGSIKFNGTSAQTISGSSSTFNNIIITNTVGVSLGSAQNLYGILTLSSGAVFNIGNGLLTLLSDADTQAASVAALPSDAVLNGNLTVKRFMSAKGNVNRYMSSPVSGLTLNSLADDFYIKSSIRFYQESVFGVKTKGYTYAAVTDPFTPGKGYLIYMRNGTLPMPWDVTGPLTASQNRGDVDLNPTYTLSKPKAKPADDGWNLVGNPFPSGITWKPNDVTSWTVAHIDPVIYVTDVAGNHVYTWDGSTNTGDLPYGTIALGQAFWVKANALNPALIIHEHAKTDNTGKFFRGSNHEIPTLRISLSSGGITDNAYLLIRPEATDGLDTGLDAHKLEGDLGISLLTDDQQKLVHYATNKVGENDIELAVSAGREGACSINFESIRGFEGVAGNLYLVDRYAGLSVPIRSGTSYPFLASANPASVQERFFLSRKPYEKQQPNMISVYPVPVETVLTVEKHVNEPVTIAVLNADGEPIVQAKLLPDNQNGQAQFNLAPYPSGLYFVKAAAGSRVEVVKVWKK